MADPGFDCYDHGVSENLSFRTNHKHVSLMLHVESMFFSQQERCATLFDCAGLERATPCICSALWPLSRNTEEWSVLMRLAFTKNGVWPRESTLKNQSNKSCFLFRTSSDMNSANAQPVKPDHGSGSGSGGSEETGHWCDYETQYTAKKNVSSVQNKTLQYQDCAQASASGWTIVSRTVVEDVESCTVVKWVPSACSQLKALISWILFELLSAAFNNWSCSPSSTMMQAETWVPWAIPANLLYDLHWCQRILQLMDAVSKQS